MPQGVNGLQELRTTAIRHFQAWKKLSKEPRWSGSFWLENTRRNAKCNFLKVAKLGKERR
jgi:hypothetical protein